MFIDDKRFEIELNQINNVRYILFTSIYNQPGTIASLTDIITKHIECLSIEYNPSTYTFTIKIKKTAMRRVPGFKQDPNFYYQSVPSIFLEFIKRHEFDIAQALAARYDKPLDALNYLYSNANILANLCHVSCIADNIVCIKL